MVTTAPPANSFNGGVEASNDDDNDDDIVQESLRDGLTKQSFRSLIDKATIGTDLLKFIDLLPNCSQQYGHSLTMNALTKIIICHPLFHDRASTLIPSRLK
jgi:hypothetical protein